MSKFNCHSVLIDGKPTMYVIRGNGRFYKGGFLDALKGRVQLEYPDAEFEWARDLDWSEVPTIRHQG